MDALRPDEAPLIFDPLEPADRDRVQTLLGSGARWLDRLDRMRAELAEVRAPGRFPDPAAAGPAVPDGRERQTSGKVVYFPWLHLLMPCLDREEFAEVRTARNQHRLRREEQRRLAQATLTFVGCSVGASIALACTMQGLGRRFHLLDPDTLGLTNLNRLPLGLPELGENKALLLARRLWLLDPYLEISVWAAGAQAENLAPIVAESDVVIEECDDLAVKIEVRRLARTLGKPVVMATDDGGGLLDVEDFRTGPRPLLHGLLEGLEPDEVRRWSLAARLALIARVLGPAAPAPFLASLEELGQGRSGGLSQLAEDTQLAAAMVVRAVTGLLLPERGLSSGRWRADLGLPPSDVRPSGIP